MTIWTFYIFYFFLSQILENFPHSRGPNSFKEDLHQLVKDIQSMGQEIPRLQNCRVFLPSIPIVCGRGDATCDIMVRPLDQLVEYICYLWDQQKKDLAIDQQYITFIDHPRLDSEYATPGDGNFCSDGIHPSPQVRKKNVYSGIHYITCSIVTQTLNISC